jgi:hypothetical protein
VPDSERLVAIGGNTASADPDPFSYSGYQYALANSHSFAAMTAAPQMILRFAYSDGARVERTNAALVSASVFTTA